jgi:hypothetical protein
MGFTDHCDLYGAVEEAGVNRVIGDIMRQRPSLFNYATEDIAHNSELWCAPVPHTPDVTNYGNPLFTIVNPLPILGADAPPVGIGFCAQLTRAEIDFFPGNTIPLPPELHPPLENQRFSLLLRLCGAIECPAQETIERVPAGGQFSDQVGATVVKGPAPIVLQGRLNCFCLDVVAIGHIRQQTVAGIPSLLIQVDELDVVGVEPEGLEANMVCYLKTTVNVVLREKLTVAIETLMLSFSLFGLGTVTLAPTPNPPIPNNPAVEDDQVKAFMTMTII